MRWNSDKQIICKECNLQPAKMKRDQTCLLCYNRDRRNLIQFKGELDNSDVKSDVIRKKYQHRAEILFGQKHPTFSYQPAAFNLGNTKYLPDFYDPIRNVFYEVIGSRQRFQQLKGKLKRFKELFPNMKLLVCLGDGKPYHSTKTQEIVGDSKENMNLFS